MKIAFLNIYSGINNRGAESFAHDLAKRLKDKNEVDFYSGDKLNTKIVQPEHRRTFLKIFFLDPASISVLIFTLKIFWQLWKQKYDWIIPMNGFWQVLLCKFLPGKILITGHSGPGWDERWNLYLKPDVFVATTEPTAKWARKTCSWTRVVTIPYGIDTEIFSKAKPAKLNLERPIILCPAAAVPYKRVDLAIRAVAKLKKGSLLHLGNGPLKSELDKLGKQLLGKRYFSTSVPYSEVPGYFAASDIVTLPSSSQENSPMVFLEAMAAGKPIVVTDAPRPKWILGDSGKFVNPIDTNKYAAALRKPRPFIAKQVEKYSWPKIFADYEKLFASPRQT